MRRSKAAHARAHKRLAINAGEVLRESILRFPSLSPEQCNKSELPVGSGFGFVLVSEPLKILEEDIYDANNKCPGASGMD